MSENSSTAKQRQIALPKRRWYLPRTWRRNIGLPPRKPISSTRQIMRQALRMIKKDWQTFTSIGVVYGAGVFIFVRSFSIGGVSEGSGSGLNVVTSRFNTMMTNMSTSLSAASGIYQIIVSTICMLALVWFFREVLSGEKTSGKQCFYQGMRPLVPYLLVLAVIGVYLIPVAVGGYLMSLMQSSYMLFGWVMYVAWLIFGLLALWSLRLITHGIFALFVVTLPDMQPLRALRSAKRMVYRRRLAIWRKFLYAAFVVTLLGLIIMTPVIVLAPAIASWVFFLLTVCATLYGQAFLYTMYREIL